MSTDAWIEEHWIGEAVLPRPRRAPKLPALSVPHAPTCSRGNAALAAHAQSRDSARHPGDGLSARQDGRNVVDQQARKLTQPQSLGYRTPRQIYQGGLWICGRSALPTGCASPASRASSEGGEMLAFAHIPTGATTNNRIDIDEVNGRFVEPVAPVTPIGADIETGRVTP